MRYDIDAAVTTWYIVLVGWKKNATRNSDRPNTTNEYI